MTTIIVTHEDNEIDEFAFAAGDQVISIGRRSTNDVCIPNLSVSGMHARITIDGDSALLEDNNSTNGTYVNGRLISRQLLNAEDEIVIGKTRVNLQLATNTNAAEIQQETKQHEPPTLSPAANAEFADDLDFDEADDSLTDEPHHTPDPQVDEPPMSLSDKAKLALGREHVGREHVGREPATDGSRGGSRAATAAGIAAASGAAGAAANRAFAGDSQAAVAELPAVDADSVNSEPHPLDDLDTPMEAQSETAPELSNADSEMSEAQMNGATARASGAVIEIQNGAKSGQVLPIDKPVTTLGRPGIQIAAIMRKPDGYFLMHIESDDSVDMPTLNRDTIGDEPVMLQSGDRLNVAGIDVEFMLS